MDDSFIFQQNIQNKIEENEYYTLAGLEDFLDSDHNPRISDMSNNKIMAKKIVRDDNSVRFSIKINNNGKAYNPISLYGAEKSNGFLERVCKNNDKFRDISAKAFSLYIKFLKTKNVAWLHNAEREME
jgi:hypothetical protein